MRISKNKETEILIKKWKSSRNKKKSDGQQGWKKGSVKKGRERKKARKREAKRMRKRMKIKKKKREDTLIEK